jgi:hypothetical protein
MRHVLNDIRALLEEGLRDCGTRVTNFVSCGWMINAAL